MKEVPWIFREQKVTRRPIFDILTMITIMLSLTMMMVNEYYEANNYKGLYHYNVVGGGIIELFTQNFYSMDDYLITGVHEWGHKIWREELTNAQRRAYTKIYDNTVEYVSDYAKTNVREDFAETFEQWYQGIEIPHERYLFLENNCPKQYCS